MQLALNIVVTKDVDGLEMGVLSDGTAYLSGRGLAALCGVAPSAVIQQATQWLDGKRDGRLAKLLLNAGFAKDSLFIKVAAPPGVLSVNGLLHAYPDDVCMLVLEYYAFDAAQAGNERAVANYRKLARASLRQVIYGATGYDPQNRVPDRWRQYHDRMLLNTAPRGHFSVFREMSEIVLSAIQAGLTVDAHTVPDISVGKTWASQWEAIAGEKTYGPRTQFPHMYPDYFPQAKAGPQDAWVYPLAALGAFRQWMQETYLPKHFPNYLAGKVQKKVLLASTRDLILEAVEVHALPSGE